MRTFFRSMNVLNGLLAAAVAAAVYFAVLPILDPVVRISLPSARGESPPPEERTAASPAPAPVDYALISDQNLFHPDRKIPLEKPPERVVPKPDLLLYGTLIGSDASFAFIEDRKTPRSTAGRGKRHVTVKKGDSVGGYLLTEVEADRIVLSKGDDRVVVMLDDRQKKRSNESASPMTADPRTPPGAGPAHFQPLVSPQAATFGPQPGMAVSPQQFPASSPQQFPAAAPSSAPSQVPTGPGMAVASPQQLPQTTPSSASPAASGPGIEGLIAQPVPRAESSSMKAEPSGPTRGIGGSGTWPRTPDSVEQTRRRIEEGRRLRLQQKHDQQ